MAIDPSDAPDAAFPFEPGQELAFELAGTVRLPCPPPATATIQVLATAPDESGRRDIYLRVAHQINPRMKLIRLVRLDDVRAAAGLPAYPAPGEAQQCPPSPEADIRPRRVVQDAVLNLIDQRGERRRKPQQNTEEAGPVVLDYLREGSVYVPETARVLMVVEVGMTAAESAEYYPPITPGTAYC